MTRALIDEAFDYEIWYLVHQLLRQYHNSDRIAFEGLCICSHFRYSVGHLGGSRFQLRGEQLTKQSTLP